MEKWVKDMVTQRSCSCGSDCIIVGSGIHRADDPASAAKAYAEASWNALIERES